MIKTFKRSLKDMPTQIDLKIIKQKKKKRKISEVNKNYVHNYC